MPVRRLRKYLDDQGVEYTTLTHSPAFTAQTIAAAAHIPGREIAKTVIIKLDGALAMAVLPASFRADLRLLEEGTGARKVELATEVEFRELFPGCEVGAMPPFGNLYGMDVYVAQTLTEDEQIAFSAGTHTELIQLAYTDFERLVRPKVLAFSASV